jgi:hypothetical protein
MKPMIIYDIEIVDNKIHLDKDKFEKLIQEVYENGVKDGKTTSLIGYGNQRNNEQTTNSPKPINIYYNDDKNEMHRSFIDYKHNDTITTDNSITGQFIIDHYKEPNDGRCTFNE